MRSRSRLEPPWGEPSQSSGPDALLAARGVPAEQRGTFVAFAGGSPLALSLAASMPAATPGAPWEPSGDVLTTLVERLVGDLPSAAHRCALEVVAQAYVTREPLLRAVLGDKDTATVRFAMQPGWHQRPSPLMDLMSRRAIADEMRARGRALTFTVFEDTDRWRGYLAKAGMPPVGAVEALRTWRAPREFSTSVLLRSRLVPQGSADPVADLRSAITTALDALQVDPAGVKAYDALTATYITASRTHKAAARRLGVPYGTYRRHLALARERLVEQLLRQPAASPPRSSPEG